MKVDIDYIIELMREYTIYEGPKSKLEVGEQEDAAAGGGSKYPAVTKWESGVTRGVANQVGNTKWREINQITRGKANTLL